MSSESFASSAGAGGQSFQLTRTQQDPTKPAPGPNGPNGPIDPNGQNGQAGQNGQLNPNNGNNVIRPKRVFRGAVPGGAPFLGGPAGGAAPLPAFNPKLLPQATRDAYEQAIGGQTHAARQAGIETLKQHARTGNFAAFESLANLASNPQLTAHLDHGSAQFLRTEAVRGLKSMAGALRPSDVKHLLRALDNQSIVGREAAETLGLVATSGGPSANDAAQGLRDRVYAPDGPTPEQNIGGAPASARAADALATLYGTPAFRNDDYRTLLHGAGFGDGNKARETLTTAARNGDAAAINALQNAIRGQGGVSDEARDMAARVLSDAGRLGPGDILALEKTATTTGGTLSVAALKKMACADSPSAEAMDSLGRIAASPSRAKVSAGIAFKDGYAVADEPTRSRHAAQLLGMSEVPPEQVKDAIRLAGGLAAGGDKAAVKALEERFGREGPRGFGPAIAGQLRDAAIKGNTDSADALGRMAGLEDGKQAQLATEALRGAGVGGSARAAEALAKLAGSDKAEQRARALPALGDVAAAAARGSEVSKAALAGLRGVLSKEGDGDGRDVRGGAFDAARQMARAADKLSPEDTRALLALVDPRRKDAAKEALTALADAAGKLPAGKERDDLVSQVRKKIAERAKDLGWEDADAVAKVVGADPKDPDAQAMLKKLLEESPESSVRRIASSALSRPGVFEGLDEKTQAAVLAGVGASGDVEAARS
ncbi:MAG TPA: hypothetical protein VFB81_08075, partial [Myxococcales bacterium]|nr:hypothetical protein [Myxococcales bacterium]